jgi:hypothetical protein
MLSQLIKAATVVTVMLSERRSAVYLARSSFI